MNWFSVSLLNLILSVTGERFAVRVLVVAKGFPRPQQVGLASSAAATPEGLPIAFNLMGMTPPFATHLGTCVTSRVWARVGCGCRRRHRALASDGGQLS